MNRQLRQRILFAAMLLTQAVGCTPTEFCGPRLVEPQRATPPVSMAVSASAISAQSPLQQAAEQCSSSADVTVVPTMSIENAASSELPAPASPVLPRLVQLALENSPQLKQLTADVAAARGVAVQAGLHPNPIAGYQGDQIGSGGTAGQQGAFVNYTIVTGGKLSLAQAAAQADVARAEAALVETQADIAAQVRARFYALSAAVEGVRLAEQMSKTAHALADRLKKLQDSGQAVAGHEIAQSRALAGLARGELIQARNRRTAAEKQVAALTRAVEIENLTVLPSTAGLPYYSYDELQSRILATHSSMRSAAAQVERTRLQLELARVTPTPNVETNAYVQQDFQARTPQFGVQIGFAIPVLDRNQGNIAQAAAGVVRAAHETERARLQLRQQVNEAFERYSTNRQLLELYRASILPDQQSAFAGLGKRFEQEPAKVPFAEIVLAQQTLANSYAAYLQILTAAWQAVADLTRLTQSDQPSAPSALDLWPDPAATPQN